MSNSRSMGSLLPEQTPYGVKTIRHIRKATRVVGGKPAPSERLAKKIDTTYEYFLKEVDPLIG